LLSEKAFRKRALTDPEGHWELHYGVPRQKPGMSFEHNFKIRWLHYELARQLDPTGFQVSMNLGHVRTASDRYYIPDVSVIPMELLLPHRGERDLETFVSPLPLVVEFWSPSTSAYDVASKLPEYQRRGDLEIWLIHPYEHTLRAWRRQLDGSYADTLHTNGTVHPVALPDVSIDLDALFR
jgi:Uma2 family endonuclease